MVSITYFADYCITATDGANTRGVIEMIVARIDSTVATRYLDDMHLSDLSDLLLTKSWSIIVRKLEELEQSVYPYYVNRVARTGRDGWILEYARA